MGRRRLPLLLMGLLVTVEGFAPDKKAMEETLPAYAIALNANILNASQCRREMEVFRAGVDRGLLWSLRMLDASGAPGSGFTEGNNYWLGKRDQCKFLSAKTSMALSPPVRRNNSLYRDPELEYPPYELNFFIAHMVHNSTLQYHTTISDEDLVVLGLCLPSTCTESELTAVLEKIFRDRTLLISQLYSADFKLRKVSNLRNDNQWLLSWNMILVIVILLFVAGTAIVGTMYDMLVYQKRLRKRREFLIFDNINTAELKNEAETKREPGQEEAAISDLRPESIVGQTLMCFSIYSNVKQIFKADTGSDSVPALHGIRFLGMVWILIPHTLLFGRYFVGNRSVGYITISSFISQTISNATYSVDTFFFMSGFLMANAYLKAQKKEKKIPSWPATGVQYCRMVIKRYCRLTPAYLVTILLAILNFNWYENVSMYYMSERIACNCPNYWWRNVLYINNFFDWDELCLVWSWYLANDMQFYMIGLLLLVVSTRHLRLALGISLGLIIASICTTAYIAYSIDYYPTMDQLLNNLTTMYQRPWIRINPFLIGLGTAFLLKKLNNKLHLSTTAKAAGWTFGVLCNCSILFGMTNKDVSLAASVIYTALSRTGWGLGMMWLTVACVTNNAGIIGKFLSLPAWVPLSRLTYCVYLTNPFLINSVFLYSSYPSYVDVLTSGSLAFGLLFLSYVCAVFLSATVEMPARLLLEVALNSNRQKK
ncbi:nose resistant to fluoxetine protein 6 [Andrena cerasifolii]|uniref:nose resistant to fluoxetine protein 6 n=1 Tax=Andrena cerasifolii TaxID=2819439 RepID=UPI0040382261